MSFPFRDRPSFKDRTMGISGDDYFDDMLKNIKQRKREFFENRPKWRSQGPFDDELGSAGGSRLRAHLGDLAARHPDIADTIFNFLPEEPRPGMATVNSHVQTQKVSMEGSQPETVTIGTQTGGGGLESDVKLRSTVPDMPTSAGEASEADRGQRSQSAPPQSSVPNSSTQSTQTQKDEGIRLIPIRTDSPSGFNHPGPQVHRDTHQVPSQQANQFPPPPHASAGGHSQEEPRVRHIPIFVEGRDEPILPKDAHCEMKWGSACPGRAEQPAQRQHQQQQESYQRQAPQQQKPSQQHQHHPQQQQHHPQHHPQQHPQQHPPQPPQHPQPQQQQEHHPPPPPQKPDPLAQVAEVMKEVEALSVRVNEWKGNSRKEKEYIYLDEMLTRNLLKLDNIETEGRDEVRSARKDVIRRINAAIAVLEAKADSQNPESGGAIVGSQEQMEVESSQDASQVSQENGAQPQEPMQTDSQQQPAHS